MANTPPLSVQASEKVIVMMSGDTGFVIEMLRGIKVNLEMPLYVF